MAAGGETARRRHHLPRIQLPQRPLPVGRRAVRGAWDGGVRAGPPRPRQVRRRTLLRRQVRATTSTTWPPSSRWSRARIRASPIFLLGHSAGGVISCGYALEYQDQLAGLICESFAHQVPAPDFALAVLKGISHLAPHAHVFKLKNEDFSRDREVGRDDERRSADCARGAADEDGGRDGARRRAAEEGLPAHQAAAVDHPRHGRQGDQAEREPPLLRHGQLQRQDVEDLRRPLPRPARRTSTRRS